MPNTDFLSISYDGAGKTVERTTEATLISETKTYVVLLHEWNDYWKSFDLRGQVSHQDPEAVANDIRSSEEGRDVYAFCFEVEEVSYIVMDGERHTYKVDVKRTPLYWPDAMVVTEADVKKRFGRLSHQWQSFRELNFMGLNTVLARTGRVKRFDDDGIIVGSHF